MSGLPERWWFRQDANDAELKRFDKPEAKKQMRVGNSLQQRRNPSHRGAVLSALLALHIWFPAVLC